ncbi:2Fe-2S iron-sulfur cluster-binding protein [Pseudofulvibacter geojedonensis]|uniref:2Fe-2S iron-sulfur cluster-binding protein n=1 Tax=Pseudofulvibacter geojedonensis TaxID=1123758 RepID=A0ABW3I3X8_9FLAO
MSRFHSLHIKDIKKETSDTVSISFDVPENLKADYKFIPGQYLTLRTNINNKEIRRSYSICTEPAANDLRVAVKQIENGLFSTFANTQLKENDILDVGSPEGKFTLETNHNSKKNYAAFVAGSGITPVMSMIKDVLHHEPNSSFVLLYGNKTPENTIFYSEIENLKKEFFGRFYVYYTFTQVNEQDALFGRIDTEKVNYILKNKHKNIELNAFYLCGPEDMINTVSNTLEENKVPKSAIHYELFTAATSTPNKIDTDTLDGDAKVTITLDDEEFNVIVKENETILDAALKQGIDAPYSCQGGVCSSCICMVTEGEVTLLKNSVLTDGEIEEGLTLACQAVSKSPVIKVDFDDI